MNTIQSKKSKLATVLLAFFLGTFGIHRFYLGQTVRGILYLVLCWTLVISIISIYDAIIFLIMGEDEFDQRYNQ